MASRARGASVAIACFALAAARGSTVAAAPGDPSAAAPVHPSAAAPGHPSAAFAAAPGHPSAIAAAPGHPSATAFAVKRVGVLVADGFEMLDALGPYETLKEVQNRYYRKINLTDHAWGERGGIQCDGGRTAVSVEFAASGDGSVAASSGVAISPEFDIDADAGAERFDLVVIGAGVTTRAVEDYVRRHHARGGLILSVCTGAAVPASLGLLDGLKATTNSLFLDSFRTTYPNVDWISLFDDTRRRYIVSSPQITTCAGITAGIDGALSQIGAWCGHDVAEATRECLEWPLPLE